MKVIGRVGDTDYLVQASVEEISALADKPVTHREERNWHNIDAVRVGTSFNVKEAFAQIHRNDRRKGEVATIRRNLEAVITMLEMTEPYLEEPKQPEVVAE